MDPEGGNRPLIFLPFVVMIVHGLPHHSGAGCRTQNPILLLENEESARPSIEKRIVESGSDRPVILISADKSGELSKKALMAGAVGFLQKPFNDQALVDLINIAVEKQRRYE